MIGIKKYFSIHLVGLVLLLSAVFSGEIIAQETTQNPDVEVSNKKDVSIDVLTLSEIIPKAAELLNELTFLKDDIENLVDISKISAKNKATTDIINEIIPQYNEIKKDENVSTTELDNLKTELEQSDQSFNDTNKNLTAAIQTLEKLRDVWLGYQKKWKNYELSLSENELPVEAKQAINEAKTTIEKGLKIVVDKLNVLMKLQQDSYSNQARINKLKNQILALRQKKMVSAFEYGSIPIYSPNFYAQFNSKLWTNIKRGFTKVIWPSQVYFDNYGYLIFIQAFIAFLVVYLIRKNKELLKNSKEYSYFNNRSISAGIFFGVTTVALFHLDAKSVPLIRFSYFLIGGIAFCRLISNKEIDPWKKEFVYSLFLIIFISGIFHVFNIPVPIFRLFILAVAILGLYKLYHWKKKTITSANAKNYKWFFTLLSAYLWGIFISEIVGKEILALYMYEALIKSIILFVFVYVFIKMIRAGIIAGLQILANGNHNISQDLIDKTVNRISTIITILIIMLAALPRFLVYWNVYENISLAYEKLMSIGFNLGDVKISLGILITSISILYTAYILSTINEIVLMNSAFDNKLDKGTRLSIAQLFRYFLLFFGFLIAIAVVGFDLTNFAIVLSALSVGIGFGLQGLVNNFVSGLILLFERPIREGDTIEVEGIWSEVKKIGLRSTTVQTFDQSDIIIPNADLVYNKVVNWTLTNQRKRIKIEVGVAYGSDVNLVIDTLTEIGSSNSDLVKNHKPVVLFVNFADSTLNFELRVWAKNALDAMQVESDLRKEIDRRFREEKIEIAFPQRDLHIRSVDASISGLTASEKK
ncbi:mechanosensitive ion channel domain-containing protein [Lutibacter sp. HS1-25]|uniref:mechanosensitive ion channel domain-containing protein n=1 Tax=Lutibacter sp. HS1-25 TaxID=2485000 RepID=UPI00197C5BCF|nr:mechanosensitive ion channel domain-containing protein [Lutibacter sp. HS1-25]